MSIEPITTRALLVCGDVQAIETLAHYSQQMGMQIEICSETALATRKLCRNKFESVIVDLANGPAALELISKLHGMTSHKKAVVFAISHTEEQAKAAFQAGATFLLEKQSLPVAILRTLRAAYPMMVAERRRYFRYPLETTVFIKKAASPEFKARSLNLSDGGMALISPEPLLTGERVQVRLCLPSTADLLTIHADVCWTNPEGHAGVEFQHVAPSVRERLQNWLAVRFDECTMSPPAKGT